MPDRIRYYRTKNGNAFWEPGRQADAFSFPRSQPLGPAGEEAQKLAIGWNAKWDKRRDKVARKLGATRDDLGKAMANRIDASDALAATYLLDASERVNEARVKARKA